MRGALWDLPAARLDGISITMEMEEPGARLALSDIVEDYGLDAERLKAICKGHEWLRECLADDGVSIVVADEGGDEFYFVKDEQAQPGSAPNATQ